MAYVDLSRRFYDLAKSELESPELLVFLSDRRWRSSDGWTELLQYPRVLLLAEAGSGKTMEMREQAARLRADGKPAFFVALESLDREPLEEILSPEEERIFRVWKSEDQAMAWFFLDAVDELKLTHGKLERALNRFAKAIDGSLHRTSVVISCRPYDWRPSLDLAIVQEKLPFTSGQPIAPIDSDELFLAALRKGSDGWKAERNSPQIVGLRTVALLPLGERQIVTLAQSLGISDSVGFIAEIKRRDAWTFARRPLDLVELIASWKENGRLGTRAEQHAANVVSKLREDPSRPDRGILSEERARIGAERLALGLALTHKRTIRSPEQALDTERIEGVLDPAGLLPDWTEEERQTLLRRGLFDPATYGRVRFHHRSVQEYLAARRLLALRKLGMSTKNLGRLLFTERYGLQLVIPSMQAIAAWLALWDDNVRRELMAREPETLLSMGDPESLPIEARTKLLRAFAAAYGKGEWRGLDIPLDEVRRLAHPELTIVVREIWNAAPTSPDVKELLLELMWQGSMEGCADLARLAAIDTSLPDTLRVTAIRAIVASNKAEILKEISESILGDPSRWPGRVIYAVADDLFPSALSVTELILLIQRTREPERRVGGFSWAARQIAEAIDPLSSLAIELRNAMADLIWQGRQEEHGWHQPRGLFNYIAPALARLCDRQLEAAAPQPDEQLILSSVIANRFGDDQVDSGESGASLKRHFKENLRLRELAFWQEVKLASAAAPHADSAKDLYHRAEYGLTDPLTKDDRSWLVGALRSSGEEEYRLIALHALLRLWRSQGREQAELDEMIAAIGEDAHLEEVLREESKPTEPDARHEEWLRKDRQRKLEREEKERQRLEKWLQWKQGLDADPEGAFTSEELGATRHNLYQWLEANRGQSSRSHYNVWDAEALKRAFNENIAQQAARAFQAVWREHPPTPRSRRSAEGRSNIPSTWAQGLTGLGSESANPGWATRLTLDEVHTAAAYALVELDGFPGWLEDLAVAHQSIVDEVVGAELTAELATDEEYYPTLQNVAHASIGIKRLLAPRLLTKLPDWPSIFKDEECSHRSAHHLKQLLGILDDVVDGQDRAIAARECARQLSTTPDGPLVFTWLQGLFRFDPELATQMLEDKLASFPDKERSGRAIEAFASLFGERDTLLRFRDEETRANSLGLLVRCAYRYVSPVEDKEHEGAYTPDTRDNAENARNFLLGLLLETPGPGAQKVISDLAVDPIFAHFPDRLRLLGRRRAASDAESVALSPGEVLAVERQLEAPPHDREGLFTVMVDRLDDISIDITHDDFTDRSTLRTIQAESEMQRTLARRLRDAAKGAYTVSREDEVADLKRTDIRLTALRGDQKAVIEVKIADERWSLTELEQALRFQLVGQYLRHESCRAGCFLLTYDGTKVYWIDPGTKGRLNFAEMVEYLRRSARFIEQELGYKVRLAVQPIDLTDPSLGPVQQ